MRSRLAFLSLLAMAAMSCQEKKNVIQTTTPAVEEEDQESDAAATNKPGKKEVTTGANEADETAAAESVPVVKPSLVGSYKSNCFPSTQPANSLVYFAIFSSTTATFFGNVYSDPQCLTLVGTVRNDWTYVITDPSKIVPGAFNYDLILTASSSADPIGLRSYSIFKFDGPDHLLVGGDDNAGNDSKTETTRFPKINDMFSYTRIK